MLSLPFALFTPPKHAKPTKSWTDNQQAAPSWHRPTAAQWVPTVCQAVKSVALSGLPALLSGMEWANYLSSGPLRNSKMCFFVLVCELITILDLIRRLISVCSTFQTSFKWSETLRYENCSVILFYIETFPLVG